MEKYREEDMIVYEDNSGVMLAGSIKKAVEMPSGKIMYLMNTGDIIYNSSQILKRFGNLADIREKASSKEEFTEMCTEKMEKLERWGVDRLKSQGGEGMLDALESVFGKVENSSISTEAEDSSEGVEKKDSTENTYDTLKEIVGDLSFSSAEVLGIIRDYPEDMIKEIRAGKYDGVISELKKE